MHTERGAHRQRPPRRSGHFAAAATAVCATGVLPTLPANAAQYYDHTSNTRHTSYAGQCCTATYSQMPHQTYVNAVCVCVLEFLAMRARIHKLLQLLVLARNHHIVARVTELHRSPNNKYKIQGARPHRNSPTAVLCGLRHCVPAMHRHSTRLRWALVRPQHTACVAHL